MKTKISLVLALVSISTVPAWAGSKKQLGGASRMTASASRSTQSGSKVWLPQNQPPRIKSQPSKSPDPTTPPKKPPVRSQFVGSVPLITTNTLPTSSLVIRDHRHDGAVAPVNYSNFGALASAPPPPVLHPATQLPSTGGPAAGGVTVTIRPSQR
jgi:hypothetical protein